MDEASTGMAAAHARVADTGSSYVVLRAAISPVVTIRPIRRSDLRPLMHDLGPLVNGLYSNGAAKMLERLEDACEGYARAHVAVSLASGRPVALAAEVGKGLRRIKLSTFWVAPESRRMGVGSQLLDTCVNRWRESDILRAAVTVRRERAHELEPLFESRGFDRRILVPGRYGLDRDEIVLVWSPDAVTARAQRNAA